MRHCSTACKKGNPRDVFLKDEGNIMKYRKLIPN